MYKIIIINCFCKSSCEFISCYLPLDSSHNTVHCEVSVHSNFKYLKLRLQKEIYQTLLRKLVHTSNIGRLAKIVRKRVGIKQIPGLQYDPEQVSP